MEAKPKTIWLTGLSGAGKSTLAQAASGRLAEWGVRHYVLDGDVVRTGLCSDLGFSAGDRRENIRRVAEVAKLMNSAGLEVICALISPLRTDRNMARAIVGPENFLEIHVATSLAACERRDPKGLYRRARAGTLSGMTGVDAPYEHPLSPDLSLDTEALSVESAVRTLLQLWSGKEAH